MKYLVTGGAGYIGGVVARQLLAAGHTVVIYDNLGHGVLTGIPAGVEFVQGDIADRERLDQLFSRAAFDGVLHFAALIEAGESMREPGKFFANNTFGTGILLAAMVRHGVRHLVFSSTAAVFGNPVRIPIEEDDVKKPTNAYGESKLLVEQMLPWFSTIHGIRYATLRYFNVAGAVEGYGEAHEPETHLIPLILDAAMGKRRHIKIFGVDYDTEDGTCIRDYVHVEDIGRAHLMAMAALGSQQVPEQLQFNLGNGRGFSVRQVIAAAQRVTGKSIPVIEEVRRPGDPARLVASSQRIRQQLGWTPQVSELEDIIRSAWDWHQKRFESGN